MMCLATPQRPVTPAGTGAADQVLADTGHDVPQQLLRRERLDDYRPPFPRRVSGDQKQRLYPGYSGRASTASAVSISQTGLVGSVSPYQSVRLYVRSCDRVPRATGVTRMRTFAPTPRYWASRSVGARREKPAGVAIPRCRLVVPTLRIRRPRAHRLE